MVTEMDRELEILISLHDDPELTAEQRGKLEEALAQDPQARAALAEYRRLDGALATLSPPVVPPGLLEMSARVRGALDRVRRRHRQRRYWAAGVLATAAAAAIAAVTWLVPLLTSEGTHRQVEVAAISDFVRPPHDRVNVVRLVADRQAQGPRVSVIHVIAEPAVPSDAVETPVGVVICSVGEPAASAGSNEPLEQMNGLGLFLNGST
jgi:anti-sigma factor RsiW